MSEHITTELVEAAARHGFAESVKRLGPVADGVTFDGMTQADQYQAKEAALTMLELVVPVLLDRGWRPPALVTDLPF